MASLSRKHQLQQVSWQVLEDLSFCSERYRRLAALGAEVLDEQQRLNSPAAADPALDSLLPW